LKDITLYQILDKYKKVALDQINTLEGTPIQPSNVKKNRKPRWPPLKSRSFIAMKSPIQIVVQRDLFRKKSFCFGAEVKFEDDQDQDLHRRYSILSRKQKYLNKLKKVSIARTFNKNMKGFVGFSKVNEQKKNK